MKNAPFLNLVLAVVLVIAVGWLLVAGRTIILPIVTALILVYVMLSASETLSRLPILRAVPAVLPKALVLAAFTAAILGLAFVVAATVRDLVDVLPRYQQNLDTVMQALARRFDMEAQTIWTEIVPRRSTGSTCSGSFWRRWAVSPRWASRCSLSSYMPGS